MPCFVLTLHEVNLLWAEKKNRMKWDMNEARGGVKVELLGKTTAKTLKLAENS